MCCLWRTPSTQCRSRFRFQKKKPFCCCCHCGWKWWGDQPSRQRGKDLSWIWTFQMALYSIVDMDERDQMLTTNCIYKIFSWKRVLYCWHLRNNEVWVKIPNQTVSTGEIITKWNDLFLTWDPTRLVWTCQRQILIWPVWTYIFSQKKELSLWEKHETTVKVQQHNRHPTSLGQSLDSGHCSL